ncbi:MAG: cell wall metabolism sensor histidine kinase WalK [Negativicutes bacterium]|nr:cell wall metabolism sensor histidine kinase WalK [Negativicutes bacterium]
MSVIIVLLFAVGITISMLIREHLTTNRRQELIARAQELTMRAADYLNGRVREYDFNTYINGVDASLGARIWILDKSQQIAAISSRSSGKYTGEEIEHDNAPGNLISHQDVKALTPELDQVYKGHTVAKIFQHPVYGENMMVVGVPVNDGYGGVQGAVIINASVRGLTEFLTQIYMHIVLLGLFALMMTLFVVDWLSTSVVKPLKAMEKAASAIAHGNYETRVDINTDDEVGQLGKSLNALARDLDAFVRQTERTEKLRRDFIANVSHELRTPITIIRGYNEALMDYGAVTDFETTIKYLLLINDETIRLERLVKDLLDLSRLQSGNIQIDTERIPLHALAKSTVTMLQKQAEEKGIELKMGDCEPVEVNGNGDRLIQLLVILIDNAIRYTASGGKVKVGVSTESELAVLSVTDTGIGIPPADLPYIWERFYKADKAHTRAGGGTGIGLALAKEIIELHGATAEVVSKVGQGTQFRIKFQKQISVVE